jgi:hypothetical protein
MTRNHMQETREFGGQTSPKKGRESSALTGWAWSHEMFFAVSYMHYYLRGSWGY